MILLQNRACLRERITHITIVIIMVLIGYFLGELQPLDMYLFQTQTKMSIEDIETPR